MVDRNMLVDDVAALQVTSRFVSSVSNNHVSARDCLHTSEFSLSLANLLQGMLLQSESERITLLEVRQCTKKQKLQHFHTSSSHAGGGTVAFQRGGTCDEGRKSERGGDSGRCH